MNYIAILIILLLEVFLLLERERERERERVDLVGCIRVSCADPEVRGGGGSGGPEPPPPSEFWQKCGYRIREWDRFDIAQHLC